MALDPDRGRTRLQIRSDWLLLVEGVWDFESPAFAELSVFLRELASRGH